MCGTDAVEDVIKTRGRGAGTDGGQNGVGVEFAR
jgi:hypothetical protein